MLLLITQRRYVGKDVGAWLAGRSILPYKQRVIGSSPIVPTNIFFMGA